MRRKPFEFEMTEGMRRLLARDSERRGGSLTRGLPAAQPKPAPSN